MGNTSSTHNCNVVFLGLDGSGKTSILARLSGDDPRTVLPTLGFNIRAFSLENAPLLKVWDQGGTPSMRRYWPAYYAKAHAIAFVIDSSDHRRLGECSRVMQEVLDDDLLLGVPLLVLANKQDVPNAIPSGEIEELMHLGSIRDRAWRCIACSALRDKGLYDGLRWLAEASVGARPGSKGKKPKPFVPKAGAPSAEGRDSWAEEGEGEEEAEEDEAQERRLNRRRRPTAGGAPAPAPAGAAAEDEKGETSPGAGTASPKKKGRLSSLSPRKSRSGESSEKSPRKERTGSGGFLRRGSSKKGTESSGEEEAGSTEGSEASSGKGGKDGTTAVGGTRRRRAGSAAAAKKAESSDEEEAAPPPAEEEIAEDTKRRTRSTRNRRQEGGGE